MNVFSLFLIAAGSASPMPTATPAPSPTPSGDTALERQIRLREAETGLRKAETELAKAELDKRRAEGQILPDLTSSQADVFEAGLDFLLKSIAIGALIFIALRVAPFVSEFTFSVPGGSMSGKLGPRPPPGPPLGQALGSRARLLQEALEMRKEPAPWPLLRRADEDEVYESVGVARHSIYLAHRIRRLPGGRYHRVTMYLDADESEVLDKVERVTYQLHPTFHPAEITISARADGFRYEAQAWGEFMLYALVYFKETAKPVQLTRYLNF